jgi:riboflavin synthase
MAVERAAPARGCREGEVAGVFTGLVQALGEVAAVTPAGPGMRLAIRAADIAASTRVGDSIAINGCCLTAVVVGDGALEFDAGSETLARTNLGALRGGDRVNLEPSLRMGDALGGHLVTGHIDGVATVDERSDEGAWSTIWFRTDAALLRQMAAKGSVAVDGVSLTLVDVAAERFSVALIPHTLAATTLGQRRVGDRVNIETDVLAKYVERQLAGRME